MTSCGLLPTQSSSQQYHGDNANVVNKFVSGMTTEQLIFIGIALVCLGFALNIALRYAIKRYGLMLGLVYYSAGLGLIGLLTWLVI